MDEWGRITTGLKLTLTTFNSTLASIKTLLAGGDFVLDGLDEDAHPLGEDYKCWLVSPLHASSAADPQAAARKNKWPFG